MIPPPLSPSWECNVDIDSRMTPSATLHHKSGLGSGCFGCSYSQEVREETGVVRWRWRGRGEGLLQPVSLSADSPWQHVGVWLRQRTQTHTQTSVNKFNSGTEYVIFFKNFIALRLNSWAKILTLIINVYK